MATFASVLILLTIIFVHGADTCADCTVKTIRTSRVFFMAYVSLRLYSVLKTCTPVGPETLRYGFGSTAVSDRPGYLNNTYLASIGVPSNWVIDRIGD